MKRLIAPLLLVCMTATVYAQQTPQRTQLNQTARFDESAPLMTMVARTAWGPERERSEYNSESRAGMNFTEGPVAQYPSAQMDMENLILGPTPFVSFDGPTESDNAFPLQPPDPNGVIGPGHYVGMYNLITEIFDRSGTSLTGPFPSNAFFSGFGGICETSNDGDPIVLYDQINDRWIISQFAVESTSGPSSQCVAVSATSDPLGSYFRYEFAHTPFGDYPKLGLSPSGDELFATYRMFGSSPSFLVGGIMDYAAMRNGNPAVELLLDLDPLITAVEPEVFPDGFVPVNYVGQTVSDQVPFFAGHLSLFTSGASFDQFMILNVTSFDFLTGEITVDIDRLAVDAYDANFCNSFNGCIDQPSPGSDLDALALFTMHSLSSLDFGTHFGMVVTHTVDVGENRAAIRWYEFRNTGGTWSVHQQGTYSPDANDRWMGSAAQDMNGNIFIGYTVSGPDLFPSIAYAAQTAGSPLGELNIDETIVQPGEGSHDGNRWGDYSMASVDPVQQNSFWYTHEYVNGSGEWGTRIFGVTLEVDSLPPPPVADLAISAIASTNLEVTWTDVGDDAGGEGASNRVIQYEIRLSEEPIDEANFDETTEVTYTGNPGVPGVGVQVQSIRGLQPSTLYYVAVRGRDDSGNQGPVSNVASAQTLAAPEFAADPQQIDLGLVQNGQEGTGVITVSNAATEESVLEFSFPAFAAMELLNDPLRPKNPSPTDQNIVVPPERGASAAFQGTGSEVILGAGGPDNFGYLWIDSDEPGGPPADNFFDISGIGVEVTLDQNCSFDIIDCDSAPIPLPFPFPYYGERQSEVVINDNGFIRFESGLISNSWVNQPIPNEPLPNGIIAAFWDDLGTDLSPEASLHTYFDEASTSFIIQWTNTPFFDGDESNTFQVLLYLDGRILIQYGLMEPRGGDAVGIENHEGTDGILVSRFVDYVDTGKAILFVPPLPKIISRVEPAFGTLGSGESVDVTITGGADGLPSGTYENDLLVVHNGVEGEAVLNVTLDVEGVAALQADPEVLDFGEVIAGASKTLPLTLRSVGTDSVFVSDFLFNNPDYSVSNDQNIVLGFPGAVATVLVTYVPEAIEDDASLLEIVSNAVESPLTVPLLGSGLEPPEISVEPVVLDTVEINEFTEILETRVLTVSNASPTPLEVMSRVSLNDANNPAGVYPDETAFFSRALPQDVPERALETWASAQADPKPAAPVMQGFEEGIMPPTDWARIQTNPNLTWESVMIFPWTGSFSAFVAPDLDGALQDEWLIGPEGIYSGTLSFYSAGSTTFCHDAFNFCDLEVWLLQGAPGGGDDYLLGIADASWPADFVYSETVFELDSLGLSQETRTSLAFRYIGSEGDAVFLDDISVDFEVALPPIRVEQENVVVDGNSSQELQVIYSADDEPGRFITGTVDLLSNDPVTPAVNVPFTFSIIGMPDIEVAQSALDLGAVIVGNTRTQSFYISNAGSENPSLQITGITLDGTGASNFSVSPDPSTDNPIELGSTDSLEVNLTYMPSSVAAHTAALTIASNDADEPELTIDVTGEGVPAPRIVLSDSVFSSALFTGGEEAQTLTISNEGEANSLLEFTLSMPVGTPDPESEAPQSGNPEKLLRTAQRAAIEELELTPLYLLSADSTKGDVLFEENFEQGIPSDWRVVDNEGSGLVFGDIASCGETGNYTGSMGNVACASSDVFGPANYDTELISPEIPFGQLRDVFLTYNLNYFSGTDQLDLDISIDGGETWTTMRSWTTPSGGFRSPPGEMVTVLLDPYLFGEGAKMATQLSRKLQPAGPLKTFTLRWRYYDLSPNPPWNWYVQVDDVQIVSTTDWLRLDPVAGSVAAGENIDVTLNFGAEGLSDSQFESVIAVASNDPDTPVANVNVSLDVTGAPDLFVEPLSIDFDSVTVGLNRMFTILVQNTGVLPLTISDIASTLPADFSAELVATNQDIDPFDPIEPGDNRQIKVVFSPQEMGERLGALTIQSDDPDENIVTVALGGTGLPAPAILLSPENIRFETYISASVSETLTISNTGAPGSELGFLIDARDFEEALSDSAMNAATEEVFLTHSVSQDIIDFNSVACVNEDGHTDNSYYRSFNLAEFGIETKLALREVQFGIQSARAPGGSQPVEAFIYLSDGPFPEGELTLIDSSSIVVEDQGISMVSFPLSATLPIGSEVVVEVFTPQGEVETFLFAGSNPFGQTAPTYLAASDCGLSEPTDLADLGFLDVHLVMNVVAQVPLPQLVVSPESGVVPAGESVEVLISLNDTAVELPGDFMTSLNVLTNVPSDSMSSTRPDRRQRLSSEVGIANTQVVEVPVELDVIPFTVSIEDTTVNPAQDFIVDLNIDSIDELDLSTYQLVLTYDPEMVRLLQAVTTETISESLTIQTNTSTPGRIVVAAVSDFGPNGEPQPLMIEGEGTLIKFAFRAEQRFGDVGIGLEEFFFDEGALTTFPSIGRIEIVPLFGDTNVDSRVSLFDAHYTLQSVVDLVELSEIGEVQAEVSGNQAVTAFDANLIALRVIGSIDCFPVEKGCNAASKFDASASITWGGVEQAGGGIQLPLLLEGASGPVYALQLEAQFDSERAIIEDIETSLPDTWRMEHHISDRGELRIAMMGTTPLSTGELGRLNVNFAEGADRFSMDGVVIVNESAPKELELVDVSDIPSEFVLHQNYPNPFNPTTTIAYQIAEEVDVRLEIYNILGQKIHTLVNATQKAGSYTVVWDTTQQSDELVSSGTYFYRLTAGEFEETKVLLLVK